MKKLLLLFVFLFASFMGFSQANIAISNTNYQTKYVPGSTVTYTISVVNLGPAAATNVTVTSLITNGISQMSWTGPGGSNGTGSINHTIASLASGASVSYIYTITIPQSYGGNLSVTANAAVGAGTDPNLTNNQSIDTDTKATSADISVTNTNNQVVYTPGTTTVYTVKVKNNGPLNAGGVVVSNPIPAGITNFSWVGSNGSSGTDVPLDNVIGSLFVGNEVTYTVTVQIPAGFTGNLVSTATITTATNEVTPANNTATDTDVVPTGADLVVVNTDGQTTYQPGTQNVYTITVTNNGPDVATNVVVTNAIPAGITSFSWTGSNGSSGTDVAINDTMATLANGASVTYTITMGIPVNFTGDLVDEATATSDTIDLYPENNTATDTDTMQNVANIVVTNTDNQVTYIPGGTSVYEVTVTNNGPQVATNVVVTNAIPAGITNFSWTGSNGSSGTNATLNNTIPILAVGQTITYTITVQIPVGLTGNLSSTASATSAVSDTDTTDNSVTDTDTLGVGADLVVTNTDNQDYYTAGSPSVYTITVTNNGPADAVNVVVNNPIPAGIISSSWTGDNGTSGTDTAIVDNIPLLTVGSSVVYTFTVQVPVGQTTDIVSTASATSATADPNPDCVACEDIDSSPTNVADIVIINTDGATNYIAGQSRTYTITVTNNGPSDATNVSVQGNLSAGINLTNVTWTGSNGTSGTGNVNDIIALLANGDSVTYTVVVPIPSSYPQTENLVHTVGVNAATTDPDSSCSACTDVDTPNPFANIVTVKTDNQEQFLLNENTIYTVIVRNDGPSDAVNVVINDPIPVGSNITQMTWSSSTGASGTGSLSETIPFLAVGEFVTYSIKIKVPAFFTSSTGNLVNIVSVSSGTPDPVINCPDCSDVDTPRPDYVTVDSQSYANPINGVSGPERLIKNILINEPCVQLSNFGASAPISFGYFHRNNSKFPFKEGIIIRSGIAANTEGKYTGVGTSSTGSGTQDSDLQAIMNAAGLTSQNQDASYVKFDFVPTIEDFKFNFLFASQEYGTYQCSTSFVDTFAFILTNLNDNTVQNLAVVPGTSTLISVVKIKKQLYNSGCGDLNPQYFGRYNDDNFGVGPDVGSATSQINLKGQTVSMVAQANVVPNTPYRIKLVIGDAGDSILDSAVFLEAGSFNIGGPKITGTGIYVNNEDFSGSNAFCEGTPRIIQSGTAPNPDITYSWLKDGVLMPGETNFDLEVSEAGTYTVVFTYNANGCQQSDEIVVEFKSTDFPMEDANDLYVCNDATPEFDLTLNEPVVMANYSTSDFDTYYYTTLEEAQDPAGIPIPAAETTAFLGTDGQEIWMKMVNVFLGGDCDPIEKFTLHFTTAPSGTFTYPDDGGDPGFCIGSNPNLVPVAPDLTVGGVYSAVPAGLDIDPDTGAIDLTTSLAGTYTVTYDFSGQGCDPFTVSTEVIVNPCVFTVATNSGDVCEGTPTFDLFATDAGTGATYEWTDYNGDAFSTDQNPVGVIVPTAPGSYIYTVVATLNGSPSDPSQTTLTVYPTPTASFVSVSSTICTNATTTLVFVGTPDATLNFTDGTNNYSVTLDAAGNGSFTTPSLSVDTTYTLVDVVGPTTPACSALLTDSILISVGLPTASIVGFVDSDICSGTATGLEIQGTPGATVSYTKAGVAQADVVIPAGGTLTIDTGVQTVTTTTSYIYELTNIVSSSTPPCSDTITGESATLTVHALPTATFSATTASVCENTAATLNFIGTPNATVTYNDGTADLTVTLDGTGNATVTTALLSATTTYTLVSVEETNTITCSQTLTGSVTITIDANPVITTEPTGATICINDSTTFTVVATGANLTYQWYFDNGTANNPIAGATNASYTIASPVATDAGDYTVVVTGSCGAPVTSAIATLIITQETLITTQPQASTTVCVGQPINLSVTATGTNLTYQWFRGTTALTGETNPTLDIASATTADAGTYTCVITNPCQVVTTTNAVVIVNELPTIVTQPQGTTICEGQGISLSVVATGTNLTYQWSNDAGPIAGATTATYTDASVTLAEAGNYTVTVSGACTPAVTSTVAVITVNQGATFTTQPVASTTVCSGESISLTIATTGGTNVTYQWYQGATAIAGATAATYTIANSQVADSGNYTCVVTSDSCPSVTSNVAVVVVNQAPAIASQPQSQEICVGQTATFTVVATGTNLTYQWFKGTTAIAGATANTYSIANTTEADSGDFYCEISSSSCPNIQTAIVSLLVKPLPIATISNDTPDTICAGESTQVIFNGTAGAVVIYTINGGTPETITLNAGVPTILPTGTLNETTVYELVSVTYTGPNACSQTLTGSATVTVNPLPEVALEDGYICVDPITLAVTRPYLLNTGLNEADYTFEWFDANGTIPLATNSFYEANAIGQYGVTITDIVTGCQASAYANVYQSSPPTDFDYTVSGFFANNPTVVITATPAGDYEYQLDFGPFQESNVFENITAGTHTITVRDPQACDVLTKEVLIIDYPKYFTPNGDGINDTWNISTIDGISPAKIYIFDRFGKLIKEMSTSGLGWDGTYNGQQLPATDYWFTINYQEAGINKEFRAHFSLKR